LLGLNSQHLCCKKEVMPVTPMWSREEEASIEGQTKGDIKIFHQRKNLSEIRYSFDKRTARELAGNKGDFAVQIFRRGSVGERISAKARRERSSEKKGELNRKLNQKHFFLGVR